MISILTVSKRVGWEALARAQIKKQPFVRDNLDFFEWVVVQEPSIMSRQQTLPGLSVKWLLAPERIRRSNLNASLNAGLRACSGDYVIFYQDFIELPVDCFERLFKLANETTFVTTATINADGSNDSRYLGVDLARPCRPEEWEANVAIAPMKVVRELGGFDEEYDNGWSWDNVNLAERAAMLGCSFIVDETNRPQLLHHPKVTDLPLNGNRHSLTMADIRAQRKPLRLNYLDDTIEA